KGAAAERDALRRKHRNPANERPKGAREPGEERSEQRDRLSGWGFLGMLSGVASDDNQPNNGESDRLSGWGFLGMLSGVARDADQTNHVLSDHLSD
ncbi:MAG: hypothetical protein ABEH81_11100, partial [Halopenitus sp.]